MSNPSICPTVNDFIPADKIAKINTGISTHKSRRLSRALASCASIALVAIVSVHVANADTAETTWSGGTSTTWTDSSNWSSGTPSATLSAVFNAPFTNQPTTTGATTVQGIWVTDLGAGPAGVSGLTTITTTGVLTVSGSGTLDGNADTAILLDGREIATSPSQGLPPWVIPLFPRAFLSITPAR